MMTGRGTIRSYIKNKERLYTPLNLSMILKFKVGDVVAATPEELYFVRPPYIQKYFLYGAQT